MAAPANEYPLPTWGKISDVLGGGVNQDRERWLRWGAVPPWLRPSPTPLLPGCGRAGEGGVDLLCKIKLQKAEGKIKVIKT